ncbi:translation initiation factor 2 [Thermococcus thermotolerans]|uniref:translation initiation factor 2 n=1 Tax=Thermococcus thermotolerans TaxID=2969672 RepID=UPI002158399F|nr:translation initiation factor 2 [Thermococcus thermotolerans]
MMMREYIHNRKFIHNFLTRLVAAEILFVIFGKYAIPEKSLQYGILWLLAMTPIILYLYRAEWQTLSKVYPPRDADRIANNLLMARYMIGFIPITAAILGSWFDGNLILLGPAGVLFALLAAKLLTDAGYPLSKEEKERIFRMEFG